jgi:hypothetical protein
METGGRSWLVDKLQLHHHAGTDVNIFLGRFVAGASGGLFKALEWP